MRYLWIVPVALVVDQASKLIVDNTMTPYGPSIPLLGDFFRLTYIYNEGAAFGLSLGSPFLHTVVSIVALGILIWMFVKQPRDERLLSFALSMVVGGALGNIVDRIRLNMVIDFFDIGIGTLRWPVCNFADSFVTVGIGLLVVGYSRRPADSPVHSPSAVKTPEDDAPPQRERG